MNRRRARRPEMVLRWAIFLVGFVRLVACSNITSGVVFPTPAATAIIKTIAPSTASSPAPITTQTTAPIGLHPRVEILATNLPEPDDLLLAPDGSILVSDVKQGTINTYGRDGRMHLLLSALNEPEGMAWAPDASLIIAEQGNNRLVRYDFASRSLLPWLDLVNNTADLGVDNIMGDRQHLIVPDSPNGTVLEVSWDGRSVRQLAAGLARPTSAWLEADGNILLADENANAVLRLHMGGALDKVADLPVPDDVIADADGNVFVTTLGDGAVHVIAAGQSRDVVLVRGLGEPQGLIFDSDGNLVVTDPGHHQLIRVLIH